MFKVLYTKLFILTTFLLKMKKVSQIQNVVAECLKC